MSDARILEQGYRRYEGPRLGVAAAVWALARHSLRSILGLGRRTRRKVLPWGIVALAVLPAIVFAGVLVLAPGDAAQLAAAELPSPGVYVGGTVLLIYLGAALAGPLALCDHRRSGMLALHLASPLDRNAYLLGAGLAVVGFLAGVTLLPSLAYVVLVELAGAGAQTLGGTLADAGRVAVSGTMLALVFGACSMAVAAVVDRASAAGAFVVGALVVDRLVIGALVRGLDLPEWLLVLDVNVASLSFALGVFDLPRPDGLGLALSTAATVGWTVVLLVLTRLRYARYGVGR